MADLTRRPGSRAQRVQRGHNLVVAGGVSALVAAVTGVLALVTSFTWSVPLLAAVVAAICFMLFRRLVTPRR
jgi:ABC-type transport system involved in multi-copper enzyme maturation permease subunit